MFNTFPYLLIAALISGCAVVPKYAEQPEPESCDLYTKKLELDVLEGTNSWSQCSGDGCGAARVLAAGVFVGTAVVSGSIYLVGNTLHWLEKESFCDDESARKNMTQYDHVLEAVGGEKIESEEELLEVIQQTDSSTEPAS